MADKKASHLQPKYVRAFIKNALNFFKLFLDVYIERFQEQGGDAFSEIIQSDLMKSIEVKPDRKIGESTLIKYVNTLADWEFIEVTLKKRNGRYSKHIKPTVRGILAVTLYTMSCKYIERFENIIALRVPTISILVENEISLSEIMTRVVKTPTLLDFYVIQCSRLSSSSIAIFQKFSNSISLTNLELSEKKFRDFGNFSLSDVPLLDFFRMQIPLELPQRAFNQVKSVKSFLEVLDLYIFLLIYVTIREYSQKHKDMPRLVSKPATEFEILENMFNKFKWDYVEKVFSICGSLFFTFGPNATEENILQQLSQITNQDSNIILKAALYRYILELEHKKGLEKEKILKRYSSYGVETLNDLETLLEEKKLYQTENLADINKLREIEEQIKQLRKLRKNFETNQEK